MVFNAASRFGFAWKCLIDIDVGVIDAYFRGKVSVIHRFDLDFEVTVGDRIAQLIIEKSLIRFLRWKIWIPPLKGLVGLGPKRFRCNFLIVVFKFFELFIFV